MVDEARRRVMGDVVEERVAGAQRADGVGLTERAGCAFDDVSVGVGDAVASDADDDLGDSRSGRG